MNNLSHSKLFRAGLFVALAFLGVALKPVIFPTGKAGQPDQTVVVWGSYCNSNKCAPAALLFGRIPVDEQFVIKTLLEKPEIKTLCIRSNGGSAPGGASLSSWLTHNGYDTCVPRVAPDQAACASACTVVFAGGRQRLVDPHVAFAIHGTAVPWLINDQPDTFTGAPGTLSGRFAFLQSLSTFANKCTSAISYVRTLATTPSSEAMEKLLGESVWIPAHTIKLVSQTELQDWKLTTALTKTDLYWIFKP